LEDPADTVAADSLVVAKGMELGALRYKQGFAEGEILKEFEILGSILFSFISHELESIDEPGTRAELMICAHRVQKAVSLIHQAAVTEFLQLLKRQLSEREDRLHAFNRALSHEFRNKIGAADGAAQLLDLPELDDAERRRLRGIVTRNLGSMRGMIENLVELSYLNRETRQPRYVRFPAAAAEAVRLLADAAEDKGVEVRVAADVPDVEVSAAAELVLANLLGNAIKYSDPAKPQRSVEIRAHVKTVDETRRAEIVVEVADNGVGVPDADRQLIFERFYRATTTAHGVEGSGLGLTIVQDVISSLGGRVWADFPDEGGSVFAFSLPYRTTQESADSHAEATP
jgi:signal transduction histidine kinase